MAEHVERHAAVGHYSADDQYLETPPGATYEHTDAHVGPMVKFGFWLIISAVISSVGLALMYALMIREATEDQGPKQFPLAVDQAPRLPSPPTLQQFPATEQYEFRLKQEAELHSYGWVDKTAGTVHIPIQDAMRLMLERGVYTSPPQNAPAAGAHVDMFPSDASSGRVMEKRKQ